MKLYNGITSVILRVKLRDDRSSIGAGLTGLTHSSTDLVIATIADKEATTTRYRAGSSETETIGTLGTYAAPTASKCRFKEVDATNHPGLYELQLADARFAVSGAKSLRITIYGASNLIPEDVEIDLADVPLSTTSLASILTTAMTEDYTAASKTLASFVSRIHALVGGTKSSRDSSATNEPVVHRNIADSANAITETFTSASTTGTLTPS